MVRMMAKQSLENKKIENLSQGYLEPFKNAISDALGLQMHRCEESIEYMEIPPPSKRHKIYDAILKRQIA